MARPDRIPYASNVTATILAFFFPTERSFFPQPSKPKGRRPLAPNCCGIVALGMYRRDGAAEFATIVGSRRPSSNSEACTHRNGYFLRFQPVVRTSDNGTRRRIRHEPADCEYRCGSSNRKAKQSPIPLISD